MRTPYRFLTFGAALAVLTGYGLFRLHVNPPEWFVWLIAVFIAAVTWRLYGRKKPVPLVTPTEAPAGLRIGSRRWARAMFFNGLISIQELSEFYARQPEDPEDR